MSGTLATGDEWGLLPPPVAPAAAAPVAPPQLQPPPLPAPGPPQGPPQGQSVVPLFVPPPSAAAPARPPAPLPSPAPAPPVTTGAGQALVQDAAAWPALPGTAAPKPAPQAPVGPASISDAVSGNARTQFPAAPEFINANPEAAKGLRIAAGYLTSAEPDQVADIIKKTLPDAAISRDRYGNPMVEWQDKSYYVNKPGASGADMAKLVADIGAFGAAGKLVSVVSGLVPRIFMGAGVGATVSAGQDVASTLLGSDQSISGSRALLSAGAGAVSEVLVPVVARVAEQVRTLRNTPKLLDPAGAPTATAMALLRQAGIDAADYTREQLTTILTAAARAPSSRAADATATAAGNVRQGEFGIPRTAGQRTGDQAQLNLEDTLRHGGLGATAQTTMSTFDAQQREAALAAGQRIRTAASGQPVARDEATLGQTVQGQVQNAAAASTGRVNAAYAAAGPLGPGAAQPLAFSTGQGNSLMQAVRAPLHDILVDPSTTPQVVAALRRVEALDEAGTATLGELEVLRRSVGNAARGIEHTPDGLALIRVRRALDDWSDTSLQRGLYAGDDAALTRLREARAARTAHGVAFEPADAPARVGRMLEQAQRDGVTGQELFNAIYGAGQLGSAEGTAAAVAHLRTLFPGDSNPVVSALREGAVQRVFGGARSAEPSTLLAVAQRMDDALAGKGKEVMQGLFSPAEIAQMRRYSAELRDIARLGEKQNKSGTAYKASQVLQQAFLMAVGEGVGTYLGAGPVVGTVAGRLLGNAAQGAVGGARAAAATSPGGPQLARLPLSALVSAGLRGGTQAAARQATPPGLLD